MTIGAFYALLIYGRWWIPAIIDSFEMLGQQAAGGGPLDPGQVFTQGLNISGALLDGASSSGLFTNFGAAIALVFAAAMCLLGFCAITIQFVMAMVESYILVAAAFVFLGFGGSRWSSPYVERYISLAVSIGVKIMLLYLLISTGMTLSSTWLAQAENIANSMQPATDAFSIMGASLIFAALCWHTPKLLASVLGGTPSLHGSDILSPIGTVAAGAAVIASGVGAVWRGAMSVAQAAGLAAGAAGSSSSREGMSGIPASSANPTPSSQPQPAPKVAEGKPSEATRVVGPPSSNGGNVKDRNDSEGKAG
jgi:type IV secretion system protein TrbL